MVENLLIRTPKRFTETLPIRTLDPEIDLSKFEIRTSFSLALKKVGSYMRGVTVCYLAPTACSSYDNFNYLQITTHEFVIAF